MSGSWQTSRTGISAGNESCNGVEKYYSQTSMLIRVLTHAKNLQRYRKKKEKKRSGGRDVRIARNWRRRCAHFRFICFCNAMVMLMSMSDPGGAYARARPQRMWRLV